MGVIRSTLLFIVGLLLLGTLILGNLALTVSMSLSYDNFASEFKQIGKDVMDNEFGLTSQIRMEYPLMVVGCNNSSVYSFNDSKLNYSFEIPCEVVLNGTESILDYSISESSKEFYYKKYDCGIWECFKEKGEPFVLVSEKARDYWTGKFYLLLFISILLVGAMVFLKENKIGAFFSVGIVVVLSSLPFIKLNIFMGAIFNFLFSSLMKNSVVAGLSPSALIGVFSVFFAKSQKVFLIMFIIGLILIVVGLLIKFLGFSFRMGEFIERFSSKKKQPVGKETAVKNVEKQPVEKQPVSNKKIKK